MEGIKVETSLFIARLMGPILIISSLSALNRDFYLNLIKDIKNNAALLFIAGIMALTLGLTLVNVHNIWVYDWPVIITIFGWLSIIAGVIRILLPTLVFKIADIFTQNHSIIMVIMTLNFALGAYLTAVGYKLF